MSYHKLPSLRAGLRRLHAWLTTPRCPAGCPCVGCTYEDQARRRQ